MSINKGYESTKTAKTKDIPEETRKCSICGAEKPISDFHWNKRDGYRNICKICKNFNSRTGTKRDELKKFSGIDLQQMVEDMKKAPSEESANENVRNSIISQFTDIVKQFRNDINCFTYMRSDFENDTSSKELVEKTINDLTAILKFMEV
jgi:hypothetical protein